MSVAAAAASAPWYAPYLMPLLNVAISSTVAWMTASWVAKRNARKQAFSEILNKIDDVESLAEGLFLVQGSHADADALFRRVCTADGRLGRRITELFREHTSRGSLAGSDPVPYAITAARIAL